MVKRLVEEGYWVRGVDLKEPEFSPSRAHEFVRGDLRDANFVSRVIQFKGYRVTSIILFLIDLFKHSMRSISLLLIWVVQVSFSLVKMMQTSCTTPVLLI